MNKNIQTKIKTEVSCPKCGKIIDFSTLKNAIKSRIDLELDSILEKI